MHQAVRERVIFRNFILLAVGLVCIWVAHKLHIEESTKLIIDLLILILATCLGMWMEFLVVPALFRRRELRRLIAESGEAAEQSKTLDMVLEEIIEQFRQHLGRVKSGYFTDRHETVPDLSLRTVKAIERSAFATFVDDAREKIYKTAKGQDYINAWYEKAEELEKTKKAKTPKEYGLHRVFIVDKFEDTSWTIIDLIQDHLAHHVRVSVIERKRAEALAASANTEIDFGLFDDNCLMTVKAKPGDLTKLTVLVALSSGENAEQFARYRKFHEKLVSEAKTANEFLEDFETPRNTNFWAYRLREHGPSLGPPHGLSDVDARQMLDFVFKKLPKGRKDIRIAVLGLTPVLVNACEADARIAEVLLVDQSTFDCDTTSQKVRRVKKNWLTMKMAGGLDAVLGDESLNNLTVGQYRTFFRAMHLSLRPGGCLVLRTLGRFGDTEQYLSVTPQKLLDCVHQSTEENELLRAGRIIAFLHSREIAFVEETQSIETARYNGMLRQWTINRNLSKEQAETFYFPDKASPGLVLSSPSAVTISEASSGYFLESQIIKVDGSYCGNDSPLRTFYRITPFVRSSDAVSESPQNHT